MSSMCNRLAARKVLIERGYNKSPCSRGLWPPFFAGKAMALILALMPLTLSANDGSPDPETVNRTLALQLVDEGDVRGAAIEFRRLALSSDDPVRRDGYRWLSAYYYLEEEDPAVAVKMLDDIEGAKTGATWKTDLLRAEAARQAGNAGEEVFYLGSIRDGAELDENGRAFVTRQLAAALVRDGRTNEARQVLAEADVPVEDALAALDRYMAGHDKSPTLGGWLGMIPGAGYAYAGEYANATRSLILNGLFIFGMVASAQDDEWGAFAVITFFEITWYTGSIYGGIDASHRYNRQRKGMLLESISGGMVAEPDRNDIPAITLKFGF